jgi:hypothetical protein
MLWNYPTYTSTTKQKKNTVSVKGPLASTYTTLTASATDIYYPGAADDGIFVGYKEVTDYVKPMVLVNICCLYS